jgi:BirA family biotin operon repressor/biotin-[acetyl-CoA-carboxylase] ligase
MQQEIIHYLKQAQGYISGEDISRELKISRAAIWKYMQELRKDGYEIVAVPHLGYQLKGSPDKLLPQEVHFGLKTKVMGRRIFHHETLASTMDTAFRLGVEGEKEGALVVAEGQTKGKGRLGRSWSSPKGKGIYASLILRPQLSPVMVPQLTLLTAVAVCEAIRNAVKAPATIKWPNDILIDGKKVAGILTELSAEMDRVRFVVVGLGINVNTPLNVLPEAATSLKHVSQKHIDRVGLLQEVLLKFEQWYESAKRQGFGPVILEWKKYSSMLGKRVRISDQSGTVEGIAVDLDESGGLMVQSDDRSIVKCISGDVITLR